MRNRFESYISNQYTPQFIATPLDANMMYNALKDRQGTYDQLSSSLANLTPKVNYIQPSDYDAGHIREYQDVQSFYQNEGSEISKMLQDDDLSGAQSRMLAAVSNPDYRRKMQALESAYLEDKAQLEAISKLDNEYDKNIAYSLYNQNRLKNKKFDDYLSGNSSAINRAYLPEHFEHSDAIKEAAAMLHADGIPYGDGTLYAVKDAQGNDTFMYKTVEGEVESIDATKAYNGIFDYVINNPDFQKYYGFMQMAGLGDQYSESVNNQIKAAANLKAYRKETRNVSLHENWAMKKKYEEDQEAEQLGMRPTVPFTNAQPAKFEYRNGKLGVWEPRETKNTGSIFDDNSYIGGALGLTSSQSMQFRELSNEELESVSKDMRHYILENPDGQQQEIISTSTPEIPDYEVIGNRKLKPEEQAGVYQKHYEATRQTHGYVQPFKESISQREVNNLSAYNIGDQAEVRKDDGTTTSLENIYKKYGSKDVKFFRSGVTTTELGTKVPAGRTVIDIYSEGKKVGEIYSNEEYGGGVYRNNYEAADKISKFEKNPNKMEEIVEIKDKDGNSSFFLAKKETNVPVLNGTPTFDNTSIQVNYYPINNSTYNWKSEAEANRYLNANKNSSSQVTYDYREYNTAAGMRSDLFKDIK